MDGQMDRKKIKINMDGWMDKIMDGRMFKIKQRDGWLEMKKQMDGCIDKKYEKIDVLWNGYKTNIYKIRWIDKNRWMVGLMDKKRKCKGWLDGYKKLIHGWTDRKREEKNRWMVGWMDRKDMDVWMDKKANNKYGQLDGWIEKK